MTEQIKSSKPCEAGPVSDSASDLSLVISGLHEEISVKLDNEIGSKLVSFKHAIHSDLGSFVYTLQ